MKLPELLNISDVQKLVNLSFSFPDHIFIVIINRPSNINELFTWIDIIGNFESKANIYLVNLRKNPTVEIELSRCFNYLARNICILLVQNGTCVEALTYNEMTGINLNKLLQYRLH